MTPKQIAAIQTAFDTIDTVLDLQGESPEDWFRWMQDRIWYDCRDAKAALEAVLDDHYGADPRVALRAAEGRAWDTHLRCSKASVQLSAIHTSKRWNAQSQARWQRAHRRARRSWLLVQLRQQRLEDYDRAALEAAS